jgi:hypothetical protein
MSRLVVLIDQLLSKMPFKESANIQISEREVAWHMAHSLKVIYKVAQVVEDSDPSQYRWRFNKTRSFVFFFNHIPRGKGKAPKSVLPSENMSPEDFEQEFKKAKAAVLALENLERKKFFTHPIFGMLDLKCSKKFIALHTEHHLKIIDDILK